MYDVSIAFLLIIILNIGFFYFAKFLGDNSIFIVIVLIDLICLGGLVVTMFNKITMEQLGMELGIYGDTYIKIVIGIIMLCSVSTAIYCEYKRKNKD